MELSAILYAVLGLVIFVIARSVINRLEVAGLRGRVLSYALVLLALLLAQGPVGRLSTVDFFGLLVGMLVPSLIWDVVARRRKPRTAVTSSSSIRFPDV